MTAGVPVGPARELIEAHHEAARVRCELCAGRGRIAGGVHRGEVVVRIDHAPTCRRRRRPELGAGPGATPEGSPC